MNNKTVFAYVRVSGKGQLEGNGFDRQLETIEAYCKKNNYIIERVFKEQVSGTTDVEDREEFSDMVSEILKNGTNIIIVERLDRLAREYRIQEQLLIYLAAKGITLISAATSEDVTESINADPMKKALIQIQGIFAELEKSLLVKKLKKARDKKRLENGKCEGPKPFYSGSDVLQEIRKLRKKRKGKGHMPYAKIADELNQKGFRNAKGKEFNAAAVRAIVYREKNKK